MSFFVLYCPHKKDKFNVICQSHIKFLWSAFYAYMVNKFFYYNHFHYKAICFSYSQQQYHMPFFICCNKISLFPFQKKSNIMPFDSSMKEIKPKWWIDTAHSKPKVYLQSNGKQIGALPLKSNLLQYQNGKNTFTTICAAN